MDVLSLDQAYLDGGSFGAAISHPGTPSLPQAQLDLSTPRTSHDAWRVFNLLGYHDHVMQVAQQLQPNPPVMYKTLDMCYNHNRVACVSRTAVRCREAHIDPSKL
jgi:hypothetical protein